MLLETVLVLKIFSDLLSLKEMTLNSGWLLQGEIKKPNSKNSGNGKVQQLISFPLMLQSLDREEKLK